MRFLTSIIIIAATVSALPITDTNAPAPSAITATTPAAENVASETTTDATDNTAGQANIAATANANDYGPSQYDDFSYGYDNGPYYGGGYGPAPGPPPRPHDQDNKGGPLGQIGYGLGSVVGAPIGWLGELVGGAGAGLYNGIRGGYRRLKN